MLSQREPIPPGMKRNKKDTLSALLFLVLLVGYFSLQSFLERLSRFLELHYQIPKTITIGGEFFFIMTGFMLAQHLIWPTQRLRGKQWFFVLGGALVFGLAYGFVSSRFPMR